MRSAYSFFAALFMLAACSGGDQTSGIDGSGGPVIAAPQSYSSGTINGFGSVIVNGVRYQSDKAKILINDELSSEDNLRAGYQVTVLAHTASDGSQVADTIEFHPNLVGTISNLNLSAQEFSLMGQRVRVDSDTLFDAAIKPNYLEGLKNGDRLLVSGKLDSSGVVIATRIEKIAAGNHQAMGWVSNLNEGMGTLDINNLSINYSAASLHNFSGNQPANGQLVVATGNLDNKGVLQAKTLTRLSRGFDKNVETAELEGFITRFVSATDFDVAGTSVTTNAQTNFQNGSAANLAAGTAVELQGSVDSSGKLLAEKITFAKRVNSELAGEVTATSTLNNNGIITGTLQINGTNVKTDTRTAYEDKGNSRQKRFNFSDIAQGNFLKISGYLQNGIFIATKIERTEVESDITLKYRGLVLSVNEHSFVLLGRVINTNNQTRFKAREGDDLSEAEFYQQALGQRVRVTGQLSSGQFTATEVELLDAD